MNNFRAIKVRGAECGIEAIMLGCVTSIGGFLFGYDTIGFGLLRVTSFQN
jgi:hypothetical protein